MSSSTAFAAYPIARCQDYGSGWGLSGPNNPSLENCLKYIITNSPNDNYGKFLGQEFDSDIHDCITSNDFSIDRTDGVAQVKFFNACDDSAAGQILSVSDLSITMFVYYCDNKCTRTKTESTIFNSIGNGVSCSITYSTCGCDTCQCDNCNSDTDWGPATTAGYQQKTTRQCECDNDCNPSCRPTTEYRCAEGYYGTPTNSSKGCNQCPPDANGTLATTKRPGATKVSECYFPSGTHSGRDGTKNNLHGIFQYVTDCSHN